MEHILSAALLTASMVYLPVARPLAPVAIASLKLVISGAVMNGDRRDISLT
jgi:hypothetical protein